MKVLFAALQYEHGRPELGPSSIEYQTFFETLKNMPGVQASFFGTDDGLIEAKRNELNKKLLQTVDEQQPELVFFMLFNNELKRDTVRHITGKTKTFNWFADDHWRLSVFSRFWAPLFTLVGTTDSEAPEKYRKLGINNVVKTQWAANIQQTPRQVRNLSVSSPDIAFVGKNYGNRGSVMSYLKSQGLPARGFGKGWEGGIVDEQTMLEIFSTSKINLNFTESYFSWPKQLAKLFLKKQDGGYFLNLKHLISNIQSLLGARRAQIKARTFEIPAAGGFLLTGDADNLRDYYVDGKEIVIFKNKKDLAEKCRYYLAHEDERQKIAKAGFERTITEHTYINRFNKIFEALGLT